MGEPVKMVRNAISQKDKWGSAKFLALHPKNVSKKMFRTFGVVLELDRRADKRWLSRNLGDGANKSDN